MKRALVTLAVLLSLSAPAIAEPSGACGGGPGAQPYVHGTTSAAVCIPGGSVTIAYLGGMSFYLIADGDSGNDDPADGFVGVSSEGVARCSSDGDYNHEPGKTCGT